MSPRRTDKAAFWVVDSSMWHVTPTGAAFCGVIFSLVKTCRLWVSRLQRLQELFPMPSGAHCYNIATTNSRICHASYPRYLLQRTGRSGPSQGCRGSPVPDARPGRVRRGRIALIGAPTGVKGEVPTAALMGRQQRLQGITVGSRRHQEDMVRALKACSLRPVIDRTFGLDTLVETFRYRESGAHTCRQGWHCHRLIVSYSKLYFA